MSVWKTFGLVLGAAAVLVSCGSSKPEEKILGKMTIGDKQTQFISRDNVSCSVRASSTTNSSGERSADGASFEFRNQAGFAFVVTLPSFTMGASNQYSTSITQGDSGKTVAFTTPSGSYSTALAGSAGSCNVTVQYDLNYSHSVQASCTDVVGTRGDKASMVLSLTCR